MEHFVTAFALAAIPSRYALERGRWSETASLTLRPAEFPWSRFPQSEAILVFARASAPPGRAKPWPPGRTRRGFWRCGTA